jgi:hypothetical protein
LRSCRSYRESLAFDSGFCSLHRAPVIGLLLIVEMANAGDMRRMAVTLRPFYCLVLRFEGGECVVGMVFDHIVVNAGTYGMALGARLDINVRHCSHLMALEQFTGCTQ